MNRHRLTLTIVVILGAWLLAACGGDPEAETPAAGAQDGAAAGQTAEAGGASAAPGEASATPGEASAAPDSLEELLAYDGDDRQAVLEAGAMEEGRMMLYTTSVLEGVIEPLLAAFKEEYPFIEVQVHRDGSAEIAARILEEYAAGRHDVDVVELEPGQLSELYNLEHIVPFYTPEAEAFSEEALGIDNAWITTRESHYGVGYNTQALSESEIPKTVEDLLDERWQGEIALSPGTGVRWLGAYVENGYEDVMKGLADQDVTVHNVSGRALVDLVISGEVLLNPHANYAHVMVSKEAGAPLEWAPLEPTFISTGALAMPAEPANPHAALLWIDYALSEEGQQIYVDQSYHVRREGLEDAVGEVDYETIPEPTVEPGESYNDLYTTWDQMFTEMFIEGS